MPGYPQLGLGSDSPVDLGFGVGLNLSRLCNSTVGGGGNVTGQSSSGLLGATASGSSSDTQNNAEIFQRLSQMLENSTELSGMSAESASAKRNYQDTQLNMYDLFGGFGSVNASNTNNQVSSQTQEEVLALLQQHHINQAIQQQLDQQRQQNQMKYGSSSLFLNKNESQSNLTKLLANNPPQQRTVRQSSIQTVSSGLGDSPISSGSSPGGQRGSRSQSSNGGYSMQPGTHSTPTSCSRAIRGSSIFRESSSPSMDHVGMMGGQRGNDCQGNSTTESSDLSMLSTSGISSMESSLNELMQSLNMSGSSAMAASPSNPFAGQGLQLSSAYQHQHHQQQQAAAQLQKQQNLASLQAALQQTGLAQLGNLTGNDLSSPQSLQTLQTNLQNIQELANLQNLQNMQSWKNLQSIQLSSLLSQSSAGGLGDRSSPMAAFSAVESALQSSWSQSTLNAAAALGLGPSYGGPVSGISGDNNLERSARSYRNAAALCDPTCTWSGHLPARSYKSATYSCKVFLGGVPWDITEPSLTNAFKQFGSIKVEWPGKDNVANPPKGYVYIIFDNEKHVKALLQACTHDFSNGGSWYYKISSRRMRSKEVQVIPWMLSDSNFVRSPTQRLDPQKTVFVGALHGMLNAEGLAHIMNDLFGGVLYAGIDTDKYKYPIGSGRVTFNNNRSYMKAVAAAFIEIKTPKFTKKVQVDPYLEDSLCANCGVQQGPYFCRDLTCFKYFCRSCWGYQHMIDPFSKHRPLMRHYKGAGAQQQNNNSVSAGGNGNNSSGSNAGSASGSNSPASPNILQQSACDMPQSPLESST